MSHPALTEKCTACSGSGIVPRDRRHLPNGQPDEFDTIAWSHVTCDRCGGAGCIPVRLESIKEPPCGI